MALLNKGSLAATVDAVNEALFFRRDVPQAESAKVARWIAGRVGVSSEERFRKGSYRGMFAPTEADFAGGIRVFTGERMPSRAGTAHVLGQEACRVMALLNAGGLTHKEALYRARQWMLVPGAVRGGTYCCATCSCAMWRHLSVSDMRGAEARLDAGMKTLRQSRAGDGRWRKFPFYYTLLALMDIDLKTARDELHYTTPLCESLLKRGPSAGKYDERRRKLMDKVLGGNRG